jgi:hypothetical protein
MVPVDCAKALEAAPKDRSTAMLAKSSLRSVLFILSFHEKSADGSAIRLTVIVGTFTIRVVLVFAAGYERIHLTALRTVDPARALRLLANHRIAFA